MDNERSTYGILAEVVRRETMFLRHYEGLVMNNIDPLNKGRILVSVPALGFDTPDIGMWAMPRHIHSMSVPDIDEWVEIYFMNADINRPVYIGSFHELNEQSDRITQFDGLPTTNVIYESPKLGDYIKHNDLTGLFKIANQITNLKTQLDLDEDAMTELQSGINGWTPVANDGGLALKTALATFLSKVMADYSKILE